MTWWVLVSVHTSYLSKHNKLLQSHLPVQNCLKFSAVLGQISANNSILIRPTSIPPIEISKNTTGFPRPTASAMTGSIILQRIDRGCELLSLSEATAQEESEEAKEGSNERRRRNTDTKEEKKKQAQRQFHILNGNKCGKHSRTTEFVRISYFVSLFSWPLEFFISYHFQFSHRYLLRSFCNRRRLHQLIVWPTGIIYFILFNSISLKQNVLPCHQQNCQIRPSSDISVSMNLYIIQMRSSMDLD